MEDKNRILDYQDTRPTAAQKRRQLAADRQAGGRGSGGRVRRMGDDTPTDQSARRTSTTAANPAVGPASPGHHERRHVGP